MLNRKALPHSLVAALAIEVRSLSRASPSIRSGRRAIALQLFLLFIPGRSTPNTICVRSSDRLRGNRCA
jgi:hypothetical protein